MLAVTPVTIPVVGVTAAIAGVALLQSPPSVASIRTMVCPTQTTESPVTGVIGFTTTGAIFGQPTAPKVIITVPADNPVTIPVEPTVASDGDPDDQEPPGVASVRVVVLPTHTLNVPNIGSGGVKTVNKVVAAHEPTV